MMERGEPRATQSRWSAASDVYRGRERRAESESGIRFLQKRFQKLRFSMRSPHFPPIFLSSQYLATLGWGIPPLQDTDLAFALPTRSVTMIVMMIANPPSEMKLPPDPRSQVPTIPLVAALR